MLRFVGFVVVAGVIATAGLVYFDVINLSGKVDVHVTQQAKDHAAQEINTLRNKVAEQVRGN